MNLKETIVETIKTDDLQNVTKELAEVVVQTHDGLNSGFIPLSYDPTLQDIRFFGAMGFLGIVGWYVGLLGSLALIVFALHAFQSGNPDSRNKAFFPKSASTVLPTGDSSRILAKALAAHSGPMGRGMSRRLWVNNTSANRSFCENLPC